VTSRASLAGACAPRNGFRFEAAGVAGTTARLADLVRGCAFELDVATLAARMLFDSPIEVGATPYRGIRAAYARSHELPPFDVAPPRAIAEAVSALRAALEAGVAHALRGARRAAVLTGGGVDSSALLALAQAWARRNDATVFGTAMEFEGPGDDRPHLVALERHLGCEVIRASPEEAGRRMELFFEGVDAAPLTWPGASMEVEALARAREHGAEVVLTGVGADELFDGDPRALARLARRHLWSAVRSARVMRGFDAPSSPALAWIVRPHAARVVPAVVRRWRSRRRPQTPPAWAGPTLVEAVRRHEEHRLDEGPRAQLSSPWESPHHEHLAWLRHQEDVAAGIECRQVFLERSLRSLVLTFPPEWLLHGAIRRGLFREAVRDLLPRPLVERVDKARFEGAFCRTLAAAGGFEHLRPLASGERLGALGLVEPHRFGQAFDAFERSPDDGEHWASLWPALGVEAFLRTHERQAGRSSS